MDEEVEINQKGETETKGRYQVKKNSMKPIDPRALKNQLNYQDPNVIIQNLSTTRRYLTNNVYQPSKLAKQESIRDATYDKIRQISFKNSKMKEKSDEADVIDKFIDKE